jgi:Flp pilus assembly protein TadD
MIRAMPIAAAVVALLLVVAGCANTNDAASADQTASAAQHLASVTGENAVEIQDAMDTLAPSCTQSEDELAGLAYAGVDDLKKNGIAMGAVEVMRQLQASVPASSAPMDCAQVLAAWLVLEENG